MFNILVSQILHFVQDDKTGNSFRSFTSFRMTGKIQDDR